MAIINATAGNYTATAFELLPTDVYRMKIKKAEIRPNTFAEPLEDGTQPDQLALIWEVSETIGDQDEGVVGLSVWQNLAPWYGTGKRGPSKFKILMDSLMSQGLLPNDTDFDAFDTDVLIDIEQRISVEEYTKTMGQNKGQLGNRIVTVMPLKAMKKQAPTNRPVPRNVPRAIEGDENLPF
jgi:hypothetical protein